MLTWLYPFKTSWMLSRVANFALSGRGMDWWFVIGGCGCAATLDVEPKLFIVIDLIDVN